MRYCFAFSLFIAYARSSGKPGAAIENRQRPPYREIARWVEELLALHERLGLTTIFVTHNQEEAFAVADLVAIMNAGKIEQYGTPDDVWRAPKSRFVAEFLESCRAITYN